MDYAKVSLEKHYEWKGKLEVVARAAVDNKEALSLAYTPGVAQPCLEIQKDVNKSYELTRRWNTVAVVTDGTAVLGLGDIGPEAGMPVMEGKCVLFKAFGDVDAIPLCVRSKDVDDIVSNLKEVLNKTKDIIKTHFNKNEELELLLEKDNKFTLLKKLQYINKLANISYVYQPNQLGTGDALLYAKEFVKNDNFLLMYGDEVMLCNLDNMPLQLIKCFEKHNKNVIGVQTCDEKDVFKYVFLIRRKIPLLKQFIQLTIKTVPFAV